MRVERSIKNLIYGGTAQAASSFLNFFTRMALVHTLGAEAVSLNGLFTEVIAMLSLAEMGVGTAIIYNLYKPLLTKDEKKLAELMNLFKSAYRMIALFIFIIGLCILPYVHLLVSRIDIDLGYLRLVYFFFLVQTASSYLFSYKASLLYADQKAYLVSRYTMYMKILSAGVSILLLILTKRYLVYLFCQIMTTLAINISVSREADRQYTFLGRKDRLPAEERKAVFSNIRHLFIGSLSSKVTNSTDNILISLLVGTLHIAAYSSYSILTNSLRAVLSQIGNATTGSVGNLMAEGDKGRMDEILRKLTFVTYCPTVLAAAGMCCASTAFVTLVFGEEYTLPQSVVYVLSFNFFIGIVRNPLWQMMEVSGLFAANKNVAIEGSTVNLIVSVILGQRYGIIGILIGTTCTFFIQIVLKINLLYGRFFELPAGGYRWMLLKLSVSYACSVALTQALCSPLRGVLEPYQEFFVMGFCSVIMAALCTFLLFWRSDEMRYVKNLGRELLKKCGR